jgi:hypothetical protein
MNWVKTEEGKPEVGKKVMLFIPQYGGITVGRWESESSGFEIWWANGTSYRNSQVTHWAPLPPEPERTGGE